MRDITMMQGEGKAVLMGQRQKLVDLCRRARYPLTAGLTKDEAIELLTAAVRGDFNGIVYNEVDKWQLLSAVARAE